MNGELSSCCDAIRRSGESTSRTSLPKRQMKDEMHNRNKASNSLLTLPRPTSSPRPSPTSRQALTFIEAPATSS
jgi:hypothetical protein